MSDEITDEIISGVLDVSSLVIAFSKVNRATHLDAKGTKESDTDHTVMLAIVACCVAAKIHPDYDLGKVAQYALVHDLVEVYSGDVVTIDHHSVDHRAKQKSEAEALSIIKKRFGKVFPWLHQTIENYEKLLDPESRFVKTIDKAMPPIAQYFSSNKVINQTFSDPESFEASMQAINDNLRSTYAHDQKPALDIRIKILEGIIDKKYQHHGKKRSK